MTDQSIFNRFNSNETPYVAFQDDNDDNEENDTSDSYILQKRQRHQHNPSSASASSSQRPNTSSRAPVFQSFLTNKQRYQQIPTKELDEDSDIDSNEAPPSLIIETPPAQQQPPPSRARSIASHRSGGGDIKEQTMWKWANVENLDVFFERVYAYYIGKGLYCILLSRCLSLLTIAFVIGFSTFLFGCVDYSLVRNSKSLSQVIIPNCVIFSGFWIIQVVRFVLDIKKLLDMYNFYTYLLEIPDAIVNQIIKIKKNNPMTSNTNQGSHERLDAHNITNRIMRQENYLIALFNKEYLNLTVPIPFIERRQFLTKALEFNLNYCILNYVFNDQGQVRKIFIKDGKRNELIEEEWTSYAKWKFREFNELPHLFQQRLDKSYKAANKYNDQFPKEKTILITRFVLFIVGSLTAVLLIASYIDPELFINFDVTPGMTVFSYTGIFVPILAISRAMIHDEHMVYEPEARLQKVVDYIHYSPVKWKEKLHTDEDIVDFFREFTVHVDDIGYVCSFAVFDFKKHGDVKYGAPTEAHNEYYVSKDGKMEKSFLNFKANHPDWEPTDPTGSLFLSKMADFNNQIIQEQYGHHQRSYSTSNNIRSSVMDSILKPHNRKGSNNVHFEIPNSNDYNNISSSSARYYNNNDMDYTDATDKKPSNVDDDEENVATGFASELGDSYLLTANKINNTMNQMFDSIEHEDRPRNGGVMGLLNQFYDLNNSSV
ncbi:4253_t:CDS:10 [Entrophospora sp. SA101]|nr:4253_t:CDS:10 [Entrophospora sp. SA101]